MGTIARGAKAGGGTNFNSGQIIDPAEVNDDLNTAVTEINGLLDDANIETATVPGAKSLRFTEIAAPSSPASNDILLYAADNAGVTVVRSKDSAGTVRTLDGADSSGNYGLGTTTFGTSAANVFAIAGSTAPTTAPADTAQVWEANNNTLAVGSGTGATAAIVGGRLNTNITAVGNVGVGEDDLITYSLPANTLTTDGQLVRVTAWGTTAANGNNKEVKLYFGATAFASVFNAAANNHDWRVEAIIVRTGAATQDGMMTAVRTSVSTPIVDFATAAETLSGAVTIKCTGTATANNDIVQEGLLVEVIN